MIKHEVIIVGGGPTGLMLAAELALANVDVAIVERRPNQELAGHRAGGLHSRAIEVLDQRGIAERFVSQGQTYPVVGFKMVFMNITDFPTRHNYVLGLRQNHIERILAEWVETLPVKFYRATEVTGFTQDETGVDVDISDGRSMRAQYLVGCDGGRSFVRKNAGIDFSGLDATTSWLIAEVEMTEEPPFGFRHNELGRHAIGKVEGDIIGVVLVEGGADHTHEPSLQDISSALVGVYGTDFGVHSPTWISRFNDASRQAASYRDRRVLLAGDAAHVHPPMGGQGLNTGVQDAVNLGWKLAQVVHQISPDSLLDTYHAERYPVGERVLKNTMAQVAFGRTDERTKAANALVDLMLAMDEPRKMMVGEVSGLDIHYELGDGHPLLGRRMPDLDIVTANGATRVCSLLHNARPIMLNFGEAGAIDIGAWRERVQPFDVEYRGEWELPVIGSVPAPQAVLIRPDGYVAWVGNEKQEGLVDALTKWFGVA